MPITAGNDIRSTITADLEEVVDGFGLGHALEGAAQDFQAFADPTDSFNTDAEKRLRQVIPGDEVVAMVYVAAQINLLRETLTEVCGILVEELRRANR